MTADLMNPLVVLPLSTLADGHGFVRWGSTHQTRETASGLRCNARRTTPGPGICWTVG